MRVELWLPNACSISIDQGASIAAIGSQSPSPSHGWNLSRIKLNPFLKPSPRELAIACGPCGHAVPSLVGVRLDEISGRVYFTLDRTFLVNLTFTRAGHSPLGFVSMDGFPFKPLPKQVRSRDNKLFGPSVPRISDRPPFPSWIQCKVKHQTYILNHQKRSSTDILNHQTQELGCLSPVVLFSPRRGSRPICQAPRPSLRVMGPSRLGAHRGSLNPSGRFFARKILGSGQELGSSCGIYMWNRGLGTKELVWTCGDFEQISDLLPGRSNRGVNGDAGRG